MPPIPVHPLVEWYAVPTHDQDTFTEWLEDVHRSPVVMVVTGGTGYDVHILSDPLAGSIVARKVEDGYVYTVTHRSTLTLGQSEHPVTIQRRLPDLTRFL